MIKHYKNLKKYFLCAKIQITKKYNIFGAKIQRFSKFLTGKIR